MGEVLTMADTPSPPAYFLSPPAPLPEAEGRKKL